MQIIRGIIIKRTMDVVNVMFGKQLKIFLENSIKQREMHPA